MYALIPKTLSIPYQSMLTAITAKMAIVQTPGITFGLTVQRVWYHDRGLFPEAFRQSRRLKAKRRVKHKKTKKSFKLFKQPLERVPVVHISKYFSEIKPISFQKDCPLANIAFTDDLKKSSTHL